MKNIALLSVLTALLAGCGSARKPVPFPRAKESNLNLLQPQQSIRNAQKVPLNQLDLPAWRFLWRFAVLTHGIMIDESQKVQFWYLAHHATKIKIVGDYGQADDLRQLLISNGVAAEITVDDICARTNTLSVYFEKQQ